MLPKAPAIEHIDAKIYSDVMDGFNLDMSSWHKCETTHCRAGHAIRLAQEEGKTLESKLGPCAAGALIYAASRPNIRVPDFHSSDDDALEDLRICTERDPIR